MLLPDSHLSSVPHDAGKEDNSSFSSRPEPQDVFKPQEREQIRQLQQRHEYERRLLGLFIDDVKQTGRCDYPAFVRFMASAYEQSKEAFSDSFFLDNLTTSLHSIIEKLQLINRNLVNL